MFIRVEDQSGNLTIWLNVNQKSWRRAGAQMS